MKYHAPIFQMNNTVMNYLISILRQALDRTKQWKGLPHAINHDNPCRCFLFTAICECDQFFCIGTNHGLFLKNKKDGSLQFLHQHNSNLPDNHVTSLACTQDGITYIGTRKGLLVWESTKSYLVTTENSNLQDNKISALALTADSVIWIGTSDGGLGKSKGRLNEIFSIQPVDTANKNIYSLSVDPNGYIWVAFLDGSFTYFRHDDSPSNSTCQHVGNKSFLLKTSNEGTFLTDGKTFEEICFAKSSGNISCAYYHPKYSRMILCDEQGINIFKIDDPWSGFRHSSYSSFIKSISQRGHCKPIDQIILRMMKSEQEPFIELFVSTQGAW
jgi:hypothetical protein